VLFKSEGDFKTHCESSEKSLLSALIDVGICNESYIFMRNHLENPRNYETAYEAR
jgi:hypothetical protein